jgi:hypothetical protein
LKKNPVVLPVVLKKNPVVLPVVLKKNPKKWRFSPFFLSKSVKNGSFLKKKFLWLNFRNGVLMRFPVVSCSFGLYFL